MLQLDSCRGFLERVTMKMKILNIAAFILIATLAIPTSGQVKSVAATNRSGNQKPVSSSTTVGSSSNTVASVSAAINPAVSSQIYRVGVRDVLDIQLTNNSSTSSTLFTVLEGGLLEYPFAVDPIVVAVL